MLTRSIYHFTYILLTLLTLSSCQEGGNGHTSQEAELCRDERFDQVLVINELMASNCTGLMADNDSLYDWVELKNVSGETINLQDYFLATVKNKRTKKDTADVLKTSKWRLPNMKMAPGEVTLVFASKLDRQRPGEELHADFKISSKKGWLQVLSRKSILAEVQYDEMEKDQSLARQEDGSYVATDYPTPSFDNTAKGYEQYCALLDRQRTSPLLIWEAHTKGSDEQTVWVELKNVCDTTLHLKDFALTAEPYAEPSWTLPDVQLAPGALYSVGIKEKNVDINGSRAIALMHRDTFVDGVCCRLAPYSASMGRISGRSGFFYLATPSRGKENSGKAYRFVAQEPAFSVKPGIYNAQKSLKIELKANSPIHYTMDGSRPTQSSPLYSKPITIDTTAVLRAYCEGDSLHMPSNIATATYFLREKRTLPVMNISINHNDLFHPTTGIYSSGPGASSEYPYFGSNFWKRDTRLAHVEYYDSTGNSFTADCGLAIFGGFSRALAKKSFKVKFKDMYGQSNLRYDLFHEGKARKHKNFVLRSGSQDMDGVMVRDEFFTSLLAEHSPTLLVQAYQPVALYINGQYFGLYYIREKVDRHYVSHHLGVSADSVNIIMSLGNVEEGPRAPYQDMLRYVRTHDMTDSTAYEYMRNLVDFDGMIDQKLGEIYAANVDVGNVRYVRSLDAKSDKKWHYVYYDLDLTWNSQRKSATYLREGSEAESGHNVVIAHLLRNKKFRQRFLERLSVHMHQTYTPENATRVFDNLINTIRPEMQHNCKRWPGFGSVKNWEQRVVKFREKLLTRNKVILDDLRRELHVTPEEDKKYFGDLGI